jgi:hypothetical protein
MSPDAPSAPEPIDHQYLSFRSMMRTWLLASSGIRSKGPNGHTNNLQLRYA